MSAAKGDEPFYVVAHALVYQDFLVPNFVIVGWREGMEPDEPLDLPGVPIAKVDENSLSVLCDRFRAAVFAKAGKADPLERP